MTPDEMPEQTPIGPDPAGGHRWQNRRARQPRTSMRAVAERAGVAMSSVSRVLSGHPDVSARMEETVMAAVRDLGYSPDLLAQGLRSRRTRSVGFTLADISNPVLAEAVLGAERELRAAGYSILLTDSEGAAELEAAHIRELEQRRVDGYLLSLADEGHAETAEVLRSLDVPMVLLDRDLPAGVIAARACFDHSAGMRDAVNHLLALGHRHVALISGGPLRPARQRREGIEAAIAAHGDGGRCTVYEGELSIEHGSRATVEILASNPRATAIIAGSNMLMHGALRALRAAGVTLGHDISFVGCDDVAVAELHSPPIAVVRRNNRSIGEHAAKLLLALFERGSQVEDIVLPTEFIARPSCGPAPST
jgi:LacI family transcriptional regulator